MMIVSIPPGDNPADPRTIRGPIGLDKGISYISLRHRPQTPRSTNQLPTLIQFPPEMLKGGHNFTPFRVNRAIEKPKKICREAENVAIATGWA